MLKRNKQQPKSRGVKNATVASLASLGAFLGSKIAKATKKKSKSKTKLSLAAERKFDVAAPIRTGRIHQGVHRHKPFEVSGTGMVALIGMDVAGTLVVRTPTGDGTTSNGFNLDPLGAGQTYNDYPSFPPTLRSTAENFSRYRVKRLVLNYEALDSTTAGRSVALAVIPEVLSSVKHPSYADIMQVPTHFITPSWQSYSMNVLSSANNQNGFRTEWCFLDKAVTANEAIMRQECVGAWMLAAVGTPPTGDPSVRADLGFLTIDYTIELDGMGPSQLFIPHASEREQEKRLDRIERLLSAATVSSSSSSSSSPYPSQRKSSEEGTIHDYLVVPQPLGRSLGAVYPNPPPYANSAHL